ncbi:MAG: LysM peptidoglycan-binding domain-containing protein [Clostridiales Family XIII bacterium]|jgi:LysM repeat protein|nr:LysM peptidoglycan-binding domain-containing protein [Clostridiales Family XIII bacterium]
MTGTYTYNLTDSFEDLKKIKSYRDNSEYNKKLTDVIESIKVNDSYRTTNPTATIKKGIPINKDAVTRTLRFLAAGFVILTIFIFLMSALPGLTSSTATAAEEIQYMDVVVLPGDSLWSLADEYASDDVSLDTFIDYVIDINDLDGNTVYVGDSLKIPVNL